MNENLAGNFTEDIDAQLSPSEIDARHAQRLLERALSQVERGDYNAAMLLCRQAIHLAPQSRQAYSVAGLLALLHGKWDEAEADYEKAIENFDEGSTERERFIALRIAKANRTPPVLTALLPDLAGEVLRLRQVIQSAPLAAFVSESAARRTRAVTDEARLLEPRASDPDSAVPPLDSGKNARPSMLRLKGQRRTSVVTALIGALLAAMIGYFVARSVRSNGEPEAATNSINATEAAPIAESAASGAATPDASSSDAASAPAPDSANTVANVTSSQDVAPTPDTAAPGGAATKAAPATFATRAGATSRSPRDETTSRLPQPAAAGKASSHATQPAPRVTQTPRRTPAEPPLPRPRITFPNPDRPVFPPAVDGTGSRAGEPDTTERNAEDGGDDSVPSATAP